MSIHASVEQGRTNGILDGYLEALALVERLHRLLLDVIKDEFERVGIIEINAVQALLLFNIGDNEVTAGELKTRGYYQGSNVSYNLKKLVEMGYMHHQRCEIDRRAVRISLTDEGRKVRDIVAELFKRHSGQIMDRDGFSEDMMPKMIGDLRGLERFVLQSPRHDLQAFFGVTSFPEAKPSVAADAAGVLFEHRVEPRDGLVRATHAV